jgi:hypothetical protein
MPTQNIQWVDNEHRIDFLFRELTLRFGPFRDWEYASYPSQEKRQEYTKFITGFAKLLGGSVEAIKMQIEFGKGVTTNGVVHHWGQGHSVVAVMNMAASVRQGFIERSEIPAMDARNQRASPRSNTTQPR